ncbi:MAG: hypothetical protein Q8P18_05885 [Pseudomonadota bacterium]|nr:hypothetical protein [Pseudomonadota bacterium]
MSASLPTVDREVMRRLILQALASGNANQWANLLYEVPRLAALQGVPLAGDADLTRSNSPLRALLLDVGWELMASGHVRPAQPESSWVFISLTEKGREALGTADANPHQPDAYVAFIRQRVPDIDATTLLYVREALAGFGADTHIACAVMAGVATESALIALTRAAVRWLPDTESGRLQRELEGKKQASRLLDELRSRLDVRKAILPSSVADHYEISLLGIATVVRLARNDAGHPSGRAYDRADTYRILLMLPDYLEVTFGLARWMNTQAPGAGVIPGRAS